MYIDEYSGMGVERNEVAYWHDKVVSGVAGRGIPANSKKIVDIAQSEVLILGLEVNLREIFMPQCSANIP